MLSILIYNRPLGITLIYLLLGLMWIASSDQIAVLWFSDNLTELTSFQIIKGFLFVIVTAIILYILIKKLYNELSTYKEDLELLFSNPKLGIIKIGTDGRIKEVSETICNMLGYSEKELQAKSYFDITHSQDIEIVEHYFNTLNDQQEQSFNYENRLVTKNGQSLWIEAHGMIKMHKNKVDYFIVAVQNIEARKTSEKDLEKELREKNALINNTDDFIFSVDRDLHIVSFNAAFKDLFKRGTGRNVQKGDFAIAKEYSKEIREIWKKYLQRALHGNQFKITEEIELQDKNIIIENKFHPIYEREKIIGVSIYGRDVTELKHAQSKISQQEEYLQVLTDHASDAILAIDTEENIQFSNQSFKNWNNNKTPPAQLEEWPKQFGLYSIDEGRLLHKEELAISKALHEGEINTHEFVIKRPGEPVRYIHANGSALYNSEGNKIGAMVVMRDITDRIDRDIQLANSILNSLEEERTMIASELHDGITQLLGVVNMNLKNIALEYPEMKESKRFQKAMEQLQNAIEESRNMSHRIMPKSIQDFGLVLSIQEITDDLEATTDLRFHFQYNKDIRLSQNKELNIYRIVQEAVNNCIVHAEASNLDINLNFNNTHLKVIIQDDGKGFDPEEAKDFGIGLRTMKNRARKMEASFTIASSNEGTSIQLDVPITS